MSKTKTLVLSKFNKLIDAISHLYETARGVQVRFAWETGRHIFEVEQDGAMRAEYGAELLPKISESLTKKYGAGFSRTNLEYMRRFYVANKISQPVGKLAWTSQLELLSVKDLKVRKALGDRAAREKLTRREVQNLVTGVRKNTSRPVKVLAPLKRPGDLKLNTFCRSKLTVKLEEDFVLLDCGFFVNWPVRRDALAGLHVSDTPSYTYAATIDRVIDGDTLSVLVEVGFGIIMHDKLRLRGIDCRELKTRAGQKAKRYLSKILPVGSTVVLKSHKTKTDHHGRFVADIFFKTAEADANKIIADGVYLNQHLIDQGFAVRMKE